MHFNKPCCKTIFIPIIKYRYSLYFISFHSFCLPFPLPCISFLHILLFITHWHLNSKWMSDSPLYRIIEFLLVWFKRRGLSVWIPINYSIFRLIAYFPPQFRSLCVKCSAYQWWYRPSFHRAVSWIERNVRLDYDYYSSSDSFGLCDTYGTLSIQI